MKTVSKAVVSVLGKDRKGIIAHVSHILYENDVNILDITQTIIDDCFSMVMMVDISDADFIKTADALEKLGHEINVQIHFQKHEIFEAMYRI